MSAPASPTVGVLGRARFASLFALARDLGPYDAWPVLPPGTDPQVHASRNDRPQPFHLVHEHDAMLVNLSGTGRVEFADGPVRHHDLVPGDHVYLPAGLAYRVVPVDECVQVVIKAEHAGLEGLEWHCPACGSILRRDEFDTDDEVVQRGYARLCEQFNADLGARTCPRCAVVHPEIDLGAFRWVAVADHIDALATITD